MTDDNTMMTVTQQAAEGSDGSGHNEKNYTLVKEITAKIKKAKDHHKDAFKKMRKNQELVHEGTTKTQYMNGKKYVANIVQRHVQQRVSALYAKNPSASYIKRQRQDFRIWDGKIQSVQLALSRLQQGVVNPNDIALIQDYSQGMARRRTLDSVGKTLVSLFQYYTEEQVPSFKLLMKQCVRRAVVTGVGYAKLDFQRLLKRNPSIQMHIDSLQQKLDKIRHTQEEVQDGDIDPESAEARDAELAMQELMEHPLDLDDEGLIFGFPQTTSIIVDPNCCQIQGFIGANWIAEEHFFSPNEVEEIFGVDLKNAKYTKYSKNSPQSVRGGGPAWTDSKGAKDPQCCVWEYYDKTTGLKYFVMDGYPDFLEEPEAPNVELERFFPYYTLVFNAVESEKELYPPSDVHLIEPMQDDYNFAREGLREHRRASRPKYVTPKGAFEEADIAALKSHMPHHVAQIQGMQPGQRAQDFISQVPNAPIDPNMYITNHLMDDVQLVVGSQEAHFGGTSNATATETSVAESSRMSSIQSNIDDLDDFLTDMARDAGKVMLMELEDETVKKIAGPGAAWPDLTEEKIEQELFLRIEAGSSGRPNKAAELANIERVLPFLVQIPNIDPTWLAKEVLKRLDDRLDVTEAIASGTPSITAINGLTGAPGDAEAAAFSDGASTGGEQNTPNVPSSAGGAQPSFNTPQPATDPQAQARQDV